MKLLFNSVVRGFGHTLGRKGADSITRRRNSTSSGSNGTLTFWQGIKTILWFFPMCMVSTVVVMIFDGITGSFKANGNYNPNFGTILVWAIIFTIIIGYNYYQDNKRLG